MSLERGDRLLRVDQAAERLAICTKSVRRLITEGRLQGVKIRRSLRVTLSSVNSYIEQQVERFKIDEGIF